MEENKEEKNRALVDRQKVTPFLLRIFINDDRHSALTDYSNNKIPPKNQELQIYTWLDASLGELTGLIREVDAFSAKGLQFSFNVVFPDNHSQHFRMRNLGLTIGGKQTDDDDITLSKSRFQIGDYLDVAILQSNADASQLNNHLNKGRVKNRLGSRR